MHKDVHRNHDMVQNDEGRMEKRTNFRWKNGNDSADSLDYLLQSVFKAEWGNPSLSVKNLQYIIDDIEHEKRRKRALEY